MTARMSTLGLGLLVGVLSTCSKESTAPSAESIVGTWSATKVQYASTTGLGTVDVIALGGVGTLVLNEDRTFQFYCALGQKTIENVVGTWDVSDGLTLTISPTNKMQFDATLSGNTLTMTGADRGYDFDNDNELEDAKLSMTLKR